MATHFSPRASQAQVRSKGFFQKIGETFGQLLGLGPNSTKRATAPQRNDAYGPVPYGERVQRSANVIFSGRSRVHERVRVPDAQILSFLDTLR